MSMATTAQAPITFKATCKRMARSVVPLSVRKRAALAVQRLTWIEEQRRHWWSVELVRDLAERDVDAFHEFLWTNHLGYAVTYEPAARFGAANMKTSRRLFFDDLRSVLPAAGMEAADVRSIFEVGCSLGYQLRFLETDLFRNADVLLGVDIDRYAVQAGSDFLRREGSRVVLRAADMRELDEVLGDTTYDVIVCTGVLMYLNQQAASEVLGTLLRRARLVALAGLAHPKFDNQFLNDSDTRDRDATFIHNFDAMVTAHGGTVIARRWEGSREVDGNTIYFVFAANRNVKAAALGEAR
jgi:SAM-dependent methyltransferase